ncbi:hypothetical protein AG1IA_08523 [Rhizoctonia solani AG-1 IA]|uniref:Uncharacterized protein n=1 Tax=Thanatephorus cucumeris (strain AG1-IA) TaxID=983506 RepID=L8WL28_THACA|nr:hypothetical protein AG1IA_08523 [Rhizoctonia solani AG-1 IA]
MLTYPRIIDPDAGVRVINKVLAQDRKSVNTVFSLFYDYTGQASQAPEYDNPTSNLTESPNLTLALVAASSACALVQLNDCRQSMASQDEGKSILAYLSRKKNNIVARLTSRSALDLSTSTPSIQPDAQSFPAGPVASQSRSAADDVVSSNSPLRHSDTDQLPATIDPLEGIDAATDTATVRVPQPITPTSPAIQALTSRLRTLHGIAGGFSPLQTAVGGLLASVEHVQVGDLGHMPAPTVYRGSQIERGSGIPSKGRNVSDAEQVESRKLTEWTGLSKSKWRSSAGSRTIELQDILWMRNRTRRKYYAGTRT